MAGTARIIGARNIERALLEAFQQWTEQDVNERYWRDQFEELWIYPGPPTIRKEKPPAGNPRDILDTEALYESGVESYRYQVGPNGAQANWHWGAKNTSGQEYAWYVHEGRGPYSRKARPWTDELGSDWLFKGSIIERKLMQRIDEHLPR